MTYLQDAVLGYESKLPLPINTQWNNSDDFETYSFDGHFFLKGKFSLDSWPIVLDRTLTMDFDADNDDWPLSLNELSGFDQASDTFAILDDINLGYNGKMYLNMVYSPLKFYLYFAEGSLVWDSYNHYLAFSGRDIDISFPTNTGINYVDMVGKELYKAVNHSDFTSYGSLGWNDGSPDVRIQSEVDLMTVSGVDIFSIEAELNNKALSLQATVKIPDVGKVAVGGEITTDSCKLQVKTGKIDFGLFTLSNPSIDFCAGQILGIDNAVEIFGGLPINDQWITMSGFNGTLYAYNQINQFSGGYLSVDYVLEAATGLSAINAVGHYGNTAKQFIFDMLVFDSFGQLLPATSKSSNKSFSETVSDTARFSGDISYQLNVSDGTIKSTYSGSIKAELKLESPPYPCGVTTKKKKVMGVKVKVPVTKFCTSKTWQTLSTINVGGNLDSQGCFKPKISGFPVSPKICAWQT